MLLSSTKRMFSSAAAGRLEGKVAVITGGASGIGRAAALLFSKNGAKVVCADKSPEVAETAAMVQAQGGQAVSIEVDVSNEANVKAMCALAESEFGRLDVLFNNAGVMLK